MDKINSFATKLSIVLILICFESNSILNCQILQKSPATPDTILLQQPDKYILNCFLVGDENNHILTLLSD